MQPNTIPYLHSEKLIFALSADLKVIFACIALVLDLYGYTSYAASVPITILMLYN